MLRLALRIALISLLIGIVERAAENVAGAQAPKRTPARPAAGAKPAQPSAVPAKPAAAKPTSAQAQAALEKGLQITGSASRELVSDQFGNQPQRWNLEIQILNNSGFALQLGNDLVLIETDNSGATREGVVFMLSGRPTYTPLGQKSTLYYIDSCYSISNYELRHLDGNGNTRKGRYVGIDVERAPTPRPPDFGSLAAGKSRSINESPLMGSWIDDKDLAGVRVALPEVSVATTAGPDAYRAVVYFQRIPSDKGWKVARRELVQLDEATLTALLAKTEADWTSRIFAANWICQRFPSKAGAAIKPTIETLRDGDLLAASLTALAEARAKGCEDKAVRLLEDTTALPWIRGLATLYLGSVGYAPAVDRIAEAATEKEQLLASAAVEALGRMGGETGSQALLKLAQAPAGRNMPLVLEMLARTRTPAAIEYLKTKAQAKEAAALTALALEAVPETYDFFVSLIQADAKHPAARQILGAISAIGGPKSANLFMELLAKESAPSPDQPLVGTPVVWELQSAKWEACQPQLDAMARQGNLRALQVLAYYSDPATRKLLLEVGQTASGSALTIALGGLSRQPDRSCLPLFEKALAEPTEDRVRQAIEAYRRVDNSLLIPAFVPLTKHPDKLVAREAVRAVTGLPPGKHAGLYLDAVLACKSYEICSPLVNALIKSKWSDPAAIRPLGEKLGQTADGAVQYQIILLLQALSGDTTLGPKDGSEFWAKPAQWVGAWKTWASTH